MSLPPRRRACYGSRDGAGVPLCVVYDGHVAELFGVEIDDLRVATPVHEPAHPGSADTHLRITRQAFDETDLSVSDRTQYQMDPVSWATNRVDVALWSKQCEILESIRDSRRVAVHSCHSIGKTFTCALATAWWIDTHPPGTAFVVTTAPTGPQVKALLWREINRLHANAGLPGRVNLTEWYLNNELVAFGRKPSEYNVAAFQGIHSVYVLVILDEACGIPTTLWTAAETIASNEGSKIVAVGNPDTVDGDFARKCQPDSGWKTIHVGYEHTPNFTGEAVPKRLRDVLISSTWVEERRLDWGGESALFQSKVLGVFPSTNADPWTVVPLRFASPCRYLDLPEDDPVEGGIDVAAGGDRTVIVERRGTKVGRIEDFKSTDPMESVGTLIDWINEWDLQKVKVDVIGVGWGLFGRLRELSFKHNPTGEWTHTAEVIPINFGEGSNYPKRFLNKRAEVWWTVGREYSRLQMWDLSNLDDDAIGELTAPKYEIMDSSGKIKIEKKEEVIKRLGRSPDIADALLLAFYSGHRGSASADAVATFRRMSLSGGSGSVSPFGGNGSRSRVFPSG